MCECPSERPTTAKAASQNTFKAQPLRIPGDCYAGISEMAILVAWLHVDLTDPLSYLVDLLENSRFKSAPHRNLLYYICSVLPNVSSLILDRGFVKRCWKPRKTSGNAPIWTRFRRLPTANVCVLSAFAHIPKLQVVNSFFFASQWGLVCIHQSPFAIAPLLDDQLVVLYLWLASNWQERVEKHLNVWIAKTTRTWWYQSED